MSLRRKIDDLYSDTDESRQLRIKLMSSLARGATAKSAAASIGVHPNTLNVWMKRGEKDSSNYKDTYYAKFYQEVMENVADKAVEVEERIADEYPLKWRTRGPGRFFGEDFSDNPTEGLEKGQAISANLDGTLNIEHLEEEDKSSTPGHHEMDALEALKELRRYGISVDELLDDAIRENLSLDEALEQKRIGEIQEEVDNDGR